MCRSWGPPEPMAAAASATCSRAAAKFTGHSMRAGGAARAGKAHSSQCPACSLKWLLWLEELGTLPLHSTDHSPRLAFCFSTEAGASKAEHRAKRLRQTAQVLS